MASSFQIHSVVSIASRWTLGVVFVVGAFGKAIDHRETITAFVHVFPDDPLVALYGVRALVIGELALAAVLVAGLWPRAMLSLAALVLLSFTSWIVYLAVTHATIGCGCGLLSLEGWLTPGQARTAAIIRNVILIVFAGVGLAAEIRGGSGGSARRSSTIPSFQKEMTA